MSVFLEGVRARAATLSRRIAFPESADARTLDAVAELTAKRIVEPVLVLDPNAPDSHARARSMGIEYVNPAADGRRSAVAAALLELRGAKGLSDEAAAIPARTPPYF